MATTIAYTEEMVGSGHPTKSDTLNKVANIITTAGDTYYGTASATLARLAIGAANTKKFTNAGATAPEWAVGIKAGVTTRDVTTATGTQAVTGVGFKPSHILFICGINLSNKMSIGIDDNTVNQGIADNHASTADTFSASTTYSIYAEFGGGASYAGTLSSLDADGFTISWTKAGSPTGTLAVMYLAFR